MKIDGSLELQIQYRDRQVIQISIHKLRSL